MTSESYGDAFSQWVRQLAEANARALGGLFSGTVPVARTSDPETSHAAARDATPTCGHGRQLVLRLLAERPLTDFELADLTGWQQTSIGKRRGECAQAGWVAATYAQGVKLTRPAPSGSATLVWQITAAGRVKLAEIIAHDG